MEFILLNEKIFLQHTMVWGIFYPSAEELENMAQIPAEDSEAGIESFLECL